MCNAGGRLIYTLYLASGTTLITLVPDSLVCMKGIRLKGQTVCSKTCKPHYRRQNPLFWGPKICCGLNGAEGDVWKRAELGLLQG